MFVLGQMRFVLLVMMFFSSAVGVKVDDKLKDIPSQNSDVARILNV